MKRREFIALLGGVAASWPLAAHAQSGGVRKIGVLMGAAPSMFSDTYLAAFLKRLEELGWVNGRNARTEVRWWTGGPEQMRPIVAELLAASPDVIMVFSNLALAVLKPMAGNVPVVFVGVGDPVGDGFVASLAHPGANITGFAGTDAPMAGKWLEVLKETAPDVTRVMAIVHLETPAHQAMWNAIRTPRRDWLWRSPPWASTMPPRSSAPRRHSRRRRMAASSCCRMLLLGRMATLSSRWHCGTACPRSMPPRAP